MRDASDLSEIFRSPLLRAALEGTAAACNDNAAAQERDRCAAEDDIADAAETFPGGLLSLY